MRWSAIRARFEPFLAPSVAGRLTLHATRYRGAHDDEGRGWITWDRRQIATFESVPFMIRRNLLSQELQELGLGVHDAWEKAREIAHQEGKFFLEEFEGAVERYPNLSIDEALVSPQPLTRALAMFDRRLGKRRLAELGGADQDPLVRLCLDLRCEAENLSLHQQTDGSPRP